MSTVAAEAGNHDHGHHKMTWRDWLFSTNHKQIGIMYLATAFIFFLIGGIQALIIRTELVEPGMQILADGTAYNGFVTLHGTIMIFLWVMPAFAGFVNYVMPMMIGARDMAFPRLNALSYWPLGIGWIADVEWFLLGRHS